MGDFRQRYKQVLMKFEDKPQYKKGKLGEDLIKKMLHQKGWMTYSPDISGAHYFDILATKNKESVIAIDVKTKARFNKWPAQGINVKHYEEYKKFTETTGVPFFLIFVDDKCGDIHSAQLNKLKNPFYPAPNIIAWQLSEMKKIGTITDKSLLDEMGMFDTRNYEYNPTNEQTNIF